MPRQTVSGSPGVLVIGCGSIGMRHIRNLLGVGVSPILAVDPRADRRDAAQALGVEAFERLEQAWPRRPTIAFITAPTSLHVPLALAAAEQGCHLFVEKPLADRVDADVERLIALAERQRLQTLVGCNLRFHPGLREIKRLCDAGAIGRVIGVRAEAGQYLPDWHPWEDYRQGYSARRELGGGIILDAIHELDYLRWMFGDVESVACFTGKLSGLAIDTEDTAGILLRFGGGMIGEVHLDYVQRTYRRTCQVIGEAGTIFWDYAAGELRWYEAAATQWHTFSNPAGWETNRMYVEELEHFLRCVAGTDTPMLPLSGGLRVLEVALAAKASSDSGQSMDARGRGVCR